MSAKKSIAIEFGMLHAWRRFSAAASAPMELRSVMSNMPHVAHCARIHAPHCLIFTVYTPGKSISPCLPSCACSSPALPSISKFAMRSKSSYAEASHADLSSSGHVGGLIAARDATSWSI